MPIKLVRREDSPDVWHLRGTVRGIRVRETTGIAIANRKKAEEFRAKREAEVLEQSVHGRPATATFAEACASYLKTGGRKRTGGSPRFMKPVLAYWRTTPLARIDLEAIEKGAAKVYPNASPQTRNRQFYTPTVAVLRHGAERRWCQPPIVARPQAEKGEPRWLRPDEAERLIAAAGKHMRPLVIFMLYTGCRSGEALWIDWSNVDLQRAHVAFVHAPQRDGTKVKTGISRGVPLHPRVVAELANLKHREGEVFRRPDGKPYERPDPEDDSDTSAGKRIRKAFAGAVERAGLGKRVPHHDPKKAKEGVTVLETDVTPHVCRHTWATWFYIGNRDLGALQKLGGWKTVQMVFRYTHVNVEEHAGKIANLPGAGTNLTQAPADTAKSA